jgi:2-C-methyl-D-erythritol 4-phosphate cytidylyltransferase
VVVVLPPGIPWQGPQPAVTGGADRLASVAAGLAALPAERDVVVVHDAAHPLAPVSAVQATVQAVMDGADAAVPFLPAADVVKRRSADGRLATVGRAGLGLAQVPMAFGRTALEQAHRLGHLAYEDSALVEAAGGTVVAVPGSSRNLHVVTEEDLEIVRILAASTPPPG